MRVEVRLGLAEQRVDQVGTASGEHARVVAQVHPDQGGDLVVAGAAGAQPAAELRADRSIRPRSRAPCTSSSVGAGAKAPGDHVGVQDVQRRQHRGELVVGEGARHGCSARACAREPARSYGASRQSNWVDLLSANIASAGPPANRPPHRQSSALGPAAGLSHVPLRRHPQQELREGGTAPGDRGSRSGSESSPAIGAEDVGQARPVEMAKARYWAAPGGVFTTTRLAERLAPTSAARRRDRVGASRVSSPRDVGRLGGR